LTKLEAHIFISAHLDQRTCTLTLIGDDHHKFSSFAGFRQVLSLMLVMP